MTTTTEATGTIYIVITPDGHGWGAAFTADVAMRCAIMKIRDADAEIGVASPLPELIEFSVTGDAAGLGAALDLFGLGL